MTRTTLKIRHLYWTRIESVYSNLNQLYCLSHWFQFRKRTWRRGRWLGWMIGKIQRYAAICSTGISHLNNNRTDSCRTHFCFRRRRPVGVSMLYTTILAPSGCGWSNWKSSHKHALGLEQQSKKNFPRITEKRRDQEQRPTFSIKRICYQQLLTRNFVPRSDWAWDVNYIFFPSTIYSVDI